MLAGSWLSYFETAGALWRYKKGGPHAAFSLAPLHADAYFNSDVIINDPALLETVCNDGLGPLIPIDTECIASYVSGRVTACAVLAQKLSRLLSLPCAIQNGEREISFGKRCVIVTDDIHSGGHIRQLIQAIQDRQGRVSVILTLGNFSSADHIDGVPVKALFNMPIARYPAMDCPLCKAGSQVLEARHKWDALAAS